jgi:hypothetical protein
LARFVRQKAVDDDDHGAAAAASRSRAFSRQLSLLAMLCAAVRLLLPLPCSRRHCLVLWRRIFFAPQQQSGDCVRQEQTRCQEQARSESRASACRCSSLGLSAAFPAVCGPAQSQSLAAQVAAGAAAAVAADQQKQQLLSGLAALALPVVGTDVMLRLNEVAAVAAAASSVPPAVSVPASAGTAPASSGAKRPRLTPDSSASSAGSGGISGSRSGSRADSAERALKRRRLDSPGHSDSEALATSPRLAPPPAAGLSRLSNVLSFVLIGSCVLLQRPLRRN